LVRSAHCSDQGQRVSPLLFFFQAEDGIRDFHVTGVQTCALPILESASRRSRSAAARSKSRMADAFSMSSASISFTVMLRPERKRSEERRVGKECRSRGSR